MADILIRGMEMPESCGMCDAQGLKNAIWHFGCGCAGDIDDFANCPPASCPIDSLPVKHGRIVDASVAEKKIKEMYMTMVNSRAEGSTEVALGLHLAASIIRTDTNVPTIVPAEGGGEDG